MLYIFYAKYVIGEEIFIVMYLFWLLLDLMPFSCKSTRRSAVNIIIRFHQEELQNTL